MILQSGRLKLLPDKFCVLVISHGGNSQAVKAEIADVVGEIRRSSAKFLSIRETVEQNLPETDNIIFHCSELFSNPGREIYKICGSDCHHGDRSGCAGKV